ncbi:hypothetical protein LIER_16295 [Lithospermum erythrorhizon]|uniref:Gag-pol polyprotein n=1 Tax=Lithospermum erythrorhizon TaxID=34254 RepID=A0AAV3QAB3_LITER
MSNSSFDNAIDVGHNIADSALQSDNIEENHEVTQEDLTDSHDYLQEESQPDLSTQVTSGTESSRPTIRAFSRNRIPSTKYPANEYILFFDGGEPIFYQEVMESDDNKHWLAIMEEEMSSLHKE